VVNPSFSLLKEESPVIKPGFLLLVGHACFAGRALTSPEKPPLFFDGCQVFQFFY
jgi:hypothetical protein